MRTIKIIALLLVFITSYAQAQNKTKSSDQTRTIEINNDNGDLYISFKNGTITEFIVNDEPVDKERYSDYQDIIDDFSDDGTQPITPPTPAPPVEEEDHSAMLYTEIIDYLTEKDLMNPDKKFKVQLNKKLLKVDGKKMPFEIHAACLDIFEEIYGHRLNSKSEVKFRKKRNSYKSSISIME